MASYNRRMFIQKTLVNPSPIDALNPSRLTAIPASLRRATKCPFLLSDLPLHATRQHHEVLLRRGSPPCSGLCRKCGRGVVNRRQRDLGPSAKRDFRAQGGPQGLRQLHPLAVREPAPGQHVGGRHQSSYVCPPPSRVMDFMRSVSVCDGPKLTACSSAEKQKMSMPQLPMIQSRRCRASPTNSTISQRPLLAAG